MKVWDTTEFDELSTEIVKVVKPGVQGEEGETAAGKRSSRRNKPMKMSDGVAPAIGPVVVRDQQAGVREPLRKRPIMYLKAMILRKK